MMVMSFVLGFSLCTATCFAVELTEEMKKEGWIAIFDGKTLDGWKSNEETEGFDITDACIVGKGGRNHLYYMEELQNFELKIDCKINKGGNSGVYVKSQWQEKSWPVTGFELQVNSSHSDPVKTGSLYNIIKILKAPHNDDEWFTYHLICKGNTLEVRVNDQTLYIYVDPSKNEELRVPPSSVGIEYAALKIITEQNKCISQKGYIALQQHDPGSKPEFKNIFIKKLTSPR